MNRIPLAEPVMRGNEWKYVKECLDSGWVSSVGSYVDRFEEVVKKFVGAEHAVAVTNGTAALHLALLVAGVHEGDAVLVPALTFIAPVNAVRYVGAEPIFFDCDPNTLCLDTDSVLRFLAEECEERADHSPYHKRTGRRVAAVIPVHVFGNPIAMDPLVAVCARSRICVIEDATESLGSTYRGRATGTIGDIGCFSFNGNKIITTGGGGMIVTNHEDFARRSRHLSTQAKKDTFWYDHDEIGYNYRLTNIQAALGVAQMEVLPAFVSRKREIAARYRDLMEGVPEVRVLEEGEGAKSNYWLSTIQVPEVHQESLLQYVNERGIQARPVWKPIHTLLMYRACETYAMEHAPQLSRSCLNLPSSVSIADEDIVFVAETVKHYFK